MDKKASKHVWPSGLRRQTQDLLGVTPHEFKSRRVQSFYTSFIGQSNFSILKFRNYGNEEIFRLLIIRYRTLKLSQMTVKDYSRSTKISVMERLMLKSSSSKLIRSSDVRLS